MILRYAAVITVITSLCPVAANLIISFPVSRTGQKIGATHDRIPAISSLNLQYSQLQVSFFFLLFRIGEQIVLNKALRNYSVGTDFHSPDPGMAIRDPLIQLLHCMNDPLRTISRFCESDSSL